MKTGVYQIEINNKKYIGSTCVSFEKRLQQHLSLLKRGLHHSVYLQRAYDKHGEDKLEFSILAESTGKDETLGLEQKYIDELKPEYNTCKIAGSRFGTKCSEETKEKIRMGQLWRDGMGFALKKKSRCTWSYLGEAIPKELTATDVGRLRWLSLEIYSNTNLLAKKMGKYVEPLSKKEIQEIVGLCRSKFSPFWNKVQKYRVIGISTVENEKYYCFNPLYFNSSDDIKPYIYETFYNELKDKVCEEN